MPARKAAPETVDEGVAGVLDDTIAPDAPDLEFGDLAEPVATDHPERDGVDFGALLKLRAPFPDSEVGLLPRSIDKGGAKLKCISQNGNRVSGDGKFCGGYHEKSIHLDFVGHAALTNRFLNADPTWTWEPMAYDATGLPALDKLGGMWIKLTIGGVTRFGYGDAQGKSMSTTAIKEIIGDALRNAGMRFGGALNLWHKGDLFENAVEQGKVAAETGPAATTARATRQRATTTAPPAAQSPAESAPAAQPPAEQTAPAPQEPAAAPSEQPVVTAPDGWRDDLKFTTTVAQMGALYKRAEAEHWWLPEVQAAFSAHRKEIEEAAKAAAAAAVSASFSQGEEVAF